MKRVALATVILSAGALVAQAQQAIRVSGRVVADDTGDPIANARVSLISPSADGSAVLADRDGRFTLPARPGSVTLAAAKTGFARREITGDAAQPIEVRLPRGVALSGRVTDAQGDLIVGARVVAETAANTATGFTVAAATNTNDRGEYRMASLAAGTFKVAVMTRGEARRQTMPGGGMAMIPSTPKTYYPDAATPDAAQALRLEPGDDRPSLDVVVPAGASMLQQMSMMAPLGYAAAPRPAVPPTGSCAGALSPRTAARCHAPRCGSW